MPMIKATGANAAGRKFLLLGLSGENVTRLAAGEPILFDMADIGEPGRDCIIVYGKTEQAIVQQLRDQGFKI